MQVEGGGIHRLWYTGGRWAYASALLDGFTDYIFITIDMSDPTTPREFGRWWIPGMNLAAGELNSAQRTTPSLLRAPVTVIESLPAGCVRPAVSVDARASAATAATFVRNAGKARPPLGKNIIVRAVG